MRSARAVRLFGAVLVGALVCRIECHAQLPSPRLDTAFPLGARAGTEVEVTLTGSDLTDPSGLFFDADGLTATKIDALKFRVAVAANCARGLHEMRLAGRYGLSTPLPFVVGDVPELLDAGSNHTRETATALSIPQVVHGRSEAEQRDFYKFSARKEQTIHIVCSACVLDSPMDPVLAILDTKNATLMRGDDELDRDAELTFVPPADGDYFLDVHDKLFAGSAKHGYRLALTFESPCSIPLLAPASVADDAISEPKPIAEVEPNDNPAAAQHIELPATVEGKFDSDWFTFRGEPSRPLWFEIIADRKRPGCDPMLVVYKVARDNDGREQSKRVLELDDSPNFPAPPFWQAGSRDPMGRFVPDQPAEYRISVSDRFRGSGHYRLIVREAAPDFALLGLGESPANEEKKIFQWQPNMRRGGSAYFHAAAIRRGYEGEIMLRAEGLPEGITASGCIPAGSSTDILVLRATADAKPWSGFFRVFGEGEGVRRELGCIHYRWNVDNRDNQRLAAHLVHCAIGVADEAAPLVIVLTETKPYEVSLGADVEITVEFERPNSQALPKGEWQIAPANFPGLKKFEPFKFDGSGAKGAKLVLHLQKDGNTLKPGTYSFFLRARGIVGYKSDAKAQARDLKHVEFSAPITVKLCEAAAASPSTAK
jgi:hypothetical protein